MTRERFDVFGIGVVPRDLTVWLSRHPAPDEKLAAEGFVESGGGPVPTALVVLSRFGYRCGFGGVAGNDPAGRFVRDELRREGVDPAGFVLREGVVTPTSLILVSGAHRTICEWGQTSLDLDPADLPPLAGCRALLVDARLPVAQAAAAREVRDAGGIVVLDAGHPRPGVKEILPLADVAIASHTYPASLPERLSPEALIEDFLGRLAPGGLCIAGVTLGAAGCLVRSAAEGLIRIPGHRVDVVDTTGAGDVFHGAFTAALLEGEDLKSAARFANAAAALKCRKRTGRAPLPSRAEIRSFADTPTRA